MDEAGAISLSSARPSKDSALTATLTDPDGVTDGTTTWGWERSAGRNSWAVIDGAASASYTPVAADTETFLRVTATYDDEHGTSKIVRDVPPNVVLGPLLTGLSAETTASSTETYLALTPTFDAETLHYRIGCAESDTITLSLSAAAGARVAVNGVQAGSGAGTASVSVDAFSEVPVTVADRDGASTTYVLHCFKADLQDLTAIKRTAGAMEDLLMFRRRDTPSNHLVIMDTNGVPRFLRVTDAQTYFRFQRVGEAGEYRYSWSRRGAQVILDEDLRFLRSVTTQPPLTRTGGHDQRLLENGNSLLMAYEPATRDLSDLPFPGPGGQPYGTSEEMADSVFQIVSPAGQALFTWNSWGNVLIEDCKTHRFPDDYGHVNGIQMVDGLIVASLRGCGKVLAVNPDLTTTDKVVWRVGQSNLAAEEWAARDIGPAPLPIVNDPEGEFCGQHAAQVLPNGNLLLYDNGHPCVINPWTNESVGRESGVFSRAVEYAMDLTNGEVVFQRDHSLHGARNLIGPAGGHVAVLDNGDWLISWGRGPGLDEVVTQVDPRTGTEKFSLRSYDVALDHQSSFRAIPLPPSALAPQPVPLTAELPASSHTSVFHGGATDSPQVVVAFSRPVVDFDETSPSLSVTGASVASVSAHVVAGEPANAYLLTLTPDGAGAITFRLDTGQACGDDGICSADGTTLAEAPAALVIGPAVSVSFEQATHSVAEGASRPVAVRLSSAHQGVRGVTVPIVLQTTGSASADVLTLDESVTFEAGETRKSLPLIALDDDLVEGDETATLGFGTLPDGVTAGSTATVTLTLTDADPADISFSVGVSQIAEGGETKLSFAFTHGVTFEVDQAIDLTVGGTATEGDDFTLVDAGNLTLSAPHAITFPAGASSVKATIHAVDDAAIEHTAETITLSAQLGLTGATLGTHTVTIPPSDVPDTPVVTIIASESSEEVAEGTYATFTLSRTASTNLPLSEALTVSVEVTATGSTLGGSAPTTVRFEGGDATADLAVLTLNDSVVEPSGTVTALIQGSTANPPVYLTGAINSATVTVVDDDVAAFTLSASSGEVAEGGTVTLTVTADAITFAEPQTITLTLGGTATPTADFTLSDDGRDLLDPYTLTLPPRARSVTVTVGAAADGETDAGESIEVSAYHDASAIGSVTITITEPPPPPVIRGGGGGRRPPPPEMEIPAITYTLKVLDNHFEQAPGNLDLQHNIPDLEVTLADGRVIPADFLSHYRRTGGITRWGHPTSEVLVLEDGTLTQFYQRGVVDFHNLGSGWVVERRLAWDYVGGGHDGSEDQGTEPEITNPHPGTLLGPWGHKVSDFAIDGTQIGFAGFFNSLGGVGAFGFPKTDARHDTGAPGTLHAPGTTLGFIRQYFQAGILEYHPEDPTAKVKLTLLGDTLRGILVPDFAEHAPFGMADPLARGAVYEPYAVPRAQGQPA